MGRHALAYALTLASAGLVSGQFENWVDNQVNASICAWEQPRGKCFLFAFGQRHWTDPLITAAVIRDTVYLDGGLVYWLQGLSNGSYGPPDEQGQRYPVMPRC